MSRLTLAPRIASKVLEEILLGGLKPGDRINEAKMAKQLNVGRSTFREALQALADSGLVIRERATLVARPTLEDALILFDVQGRLEPFAAAKACGRLTPTHTRELQLHLDKMKQAIPKGDFSTFLRHELNFHQRIWKIPQLRTLNRMFKLVMPPLFVFLRGRFSQMFSGNASHGEEMLRKQHEYDRKLLVILKTRNPREVRVAFARAIGDYWQAITGLGTRPHATS